MKILVMILFIILPLFSSQVFGEEPGTSNSNVVLFVDLTLVSTDKAQLLSEYDRAVTKIMNDITKNKGRDYLGRKIGLVFIDDKGGHSKEWEEIVPASPGFMRKEIKEFQKRISVRFQETRTKIDKNTEKYELSRFIEPLVENLPNDSDHEKTTFIVLSDLCLVDSNIDGKGSNFEKMIFGVKPEDYSERLGRVKLDIKRVNRSMLDQGMIDCIDAWWKAAFGDKTSKWSLIGEDCKKKSNPEPAPPPTSKEESIKKPPCRPCAKCPKVTPCPVNPPCSKDLPPLSTPCDATFKQPLQFICKCGGNDKLMPKWFLEIVIDGKNGLVKSTDVLRSDERALTKLEIDCIRKNLDMISFPIVGSGEYSLKFAPVNCESSVRLNF